MSESKKKVNFTPLQQAAIDYRGGTLLVSSAAGSGKTKVIVERLLKYIEKDNCNIDEFLIITYTKAAALELRSRIYDEIMERVLTSAHNKRLRRQSMLVRCANIDTIHGFCAAILRENAYLAGLPADFRVADENECDVIKSEVLDNMLSRTYDNIKELPELKALLDILIDSRDDKRLVEIVLDIHKKLMSTPNPDKWVENQIDSLNAGDKSCQLYLRETVQKRVDYCRRRMLEVRAEMRVSSDLEKAYADSVDATIEDINTLHEALAKSWDAAVKHRTVVFPRPRNISGYEDIKEIRNWCKGELNKCSEILEYSSEDHNKDMKELTPVYKMLFQLIIDFNKLYAQEKRKKSIVDFSDLEHLTLSLLIDSEKGCKTTIAENVSRRFKEIMIDEYQDVNEIQEVLFDAVSRESSNIFMVGDVKQSIYRFRLAEPEIFLEKYKKFNDYSSGSHNKTGTRINLSSNFRSRAGILNVVNDVFQNIMTEQLGDIDYSDSHELTAGRSDAKSSKGKQGKKGKQGTQECSVELNLLSTCDLPDIDDQESPSAIQLEANYVATKIQEMIKVPYLVPDKDGNMRQIDYNDIAILSRSTKGITWRFAKALNELGIPADISTGEEFFETVEISAVLSLFSVIDNPLQDIPLAAVLSGPVYRFTASQLAELRAVDRYVSLYETLKWSDEPNRMSPATVCKCKNVLKDIDEMREVVTELSSDRFIWYVYNKTGLLGLVRAMKDGERRHDNLLRIVECASSYEKSGYKGLFSFLNYLTALKERDAQTGQNSLSSFSSSSAISKGESVTKAVRILSIHKSKGLEFPVVFLVNTAKKHNYMDTSKSLVFHKDFGVGSMLIDRKRRIKYGTLVKKAIAEKLKKEMMSEELRVLYVAMTRAMEKLVITATYSDAAKRYSKIDMLKSNNNKYSPQTLASFSCLADWIIAGTINMESEDLERSNINAAEFSGSNAAVKKKVTDDKSVKQSDKDETKGSFNDEKKIEFDFEYPYKQAVDLPSKLTVTGMSRIIDPEAENAQWLSEDGYATPSHRSPIIEKEAITTAAERGIVYHDIMRYIDYNKCSSEDEMWKDLQRLIKSGLIDEKDVNDDKIDLGKIINFFKSDIGKRVIKAHTVKREFKFSLLTPANQYFNDGGEEKILFQGIIDCFFEENDEYVVVDYKTDNILAENVKKRAEKYTPQLDAYAKALERITGKRVKERIIYFLSVDTSINV